MNLQTYRNSVWGWRGEEWVAHAWWGELHWNDTLPGLSMIFILNSQLYLTYLKLCSNSPLADEMKISLWLVFICNKKYMEPPPNKVCRFTFLVYGYFPFAISCSLKTFLSLIVSIWYLQIYTADSTKCLLRSIFFLIHNPPFKCSMLFWLITKLLIFPSPILVPKTQVIGYLFEMENTFR